MLANPEDLATLMTAEQGKPLAESKGANRLRGLVPRMSARKASVSMAM